MIGINPVHVFIVNVNGTFVLVPILFNFEFLFGDVIILSMAYDIPFFVGSSEYQSSSNTASRKLRSYGYHSGLSSGLIKARTSHVISILESGSSVSATITSSFMVPLR